MDSRFNKLSKIKKHLYNHYLNLISINDGKGYIFKNADKPHTVFWQINNVVTSFSKDKDGNDLLMLTTMDNIEIVFIKIDSFNLTC